jgi:hypothetical protein
LDAVPTNIPVKEVHPVPKVGIVGIVMPCQPSSLTR